MFLAINFHPGEFLNIWDEILFGYLGVFVVVGAIIGVTAILNKLTSKKK